MKVNSLIDDKKKQRVRDAMEKGDGSIFTKKKKMTSPIVEPAARIDWSRLDLNRVEPLVTEIRAVPARGAIERANRERKIIIPNAVHDRILLETTFWQKPEIKYCYPVWTGTLIVYEAPDTPFGETVSFDKRTIDLIGHSSFLVPEKFRGKINSALVVEHPDFDLLEALGRNGLEVIVKDETAIFLLENFPKEKGWYGFDEKFRIPIGRKLEVLESDNSMRYLSRVVGSYVGLLGRGKSSDNYRPRDIGAGTTLPVDSGVAVIDRNVFESLKRGDKP